MNGKYLVILIIYAIALFLIGLKTKEKDLKIIIGLLLGLMPIVVCMVGALS